MNTQDFYNTISTCGNTANECPNTLNSHASGWIPRGFFTRVTNGPVPILAVCKNPGHMLPNEGELYRRTLPSELAKTHMQHAAVTFEGGNITRPSDQSSTVFHKNLRRYMAFILDVEPNRVFEHMVYTNLVKCSSPGEQDKLDRRTMSECFSRHFTREIEFFTPKVLIAFGREVESFLIEMKHSGAHHLPVVYLKHPSYHYRKDIEASELARAKSEVIRCLVQLDTGHLINIPSYSQRPMAQSDLHPCARIVAALEYLQDAGMTTQQLRALHHLASERESYAGAKRYFSQSKNLGKNNRSYGQRLEFVASEHRNGRNCFDQLICEATNHWPQ